MLGFGSMGEVGVYERFVIDYWGNGWASLVDIPCVFSIVSAFSEIDILNSTYHCNHPYEPRLAVPPRTPAVQFNTLLSPPSALPPSIITSPPKRPRKKRIAFRTHSNLQTPIPTVLIADFRGVS
jgi:hypothetical protein